MTKDHLRCVFIVFLLSQWGIVSGVSDCQDLANEKLQKISQIESLQERKTAILEVIDFCDAAMLVHVFLGDVLVDEGDFRRANLAYRNAIERDPESALPFLRLAKLADSQGNEKHRKAYLQTAQMLTDTEEEIAQYKKATEDSVKSEAEGQYAFKDADGIVEALDIGSPAIRPKSMSKNSFGETFANAEGLGINLTIRFDVNSAEISADSIKQVEALALALRRAETNERYLVVGHCSSEGPIEFNARLSKSRAECVKKCLVESYGINSDQIDAVGKGSIEPVIEDGVENPRKSRRVTVMRRFN